MHFEPSSFSTPHSDPDKLVQKAGVDCVAGCYRCVLSYFNQPDHEHIERRDEEMQRMLLRLAYSTTSAPEETRKEPAPLTAANEAGSVSSLAPSSGADVDAGDLPPLSQILQSSLVSRSLFCEIGIVAVEDERVTEDFARLWMQGRQAFCSSHIT